MELPDEKTKVLEWINSVSWEEKYAFFKDLLAVLPAAEIRTLENMTHKMRTRVSKKKRDGPVLKGYEPVPTEKCEPVPTLEELVLPDNNITPKGWWSSWTLEETLAIDCEHVHLVGVTGSARIKAGSVAVYNGKMELVYETNIQHKAGTFLVNKHTVCKSGFRATDLETGKPMDKVTQDLEKLFEGKNIIHFNGLMDFQSLDLQCGQYDNFDLAFYYRRPRFTKHGIDIGEQLSLRTCCWEFFKKDIQAGTHSATIDAAATMDLFLKHYVKTTSDPNNIHCKEYSQFKNIVKYDPK